MLHERIEHIAAIKQGQEAREKLREEVRVLLCRFLEDEFGYGVPKGVNATVAMSHMSAIDSLVSEIVRSLAGGW